MDRRRFIQTSTLGGLGLLLGCSGGNNPTGPSGSSSSVSGGSRSSSGRGPGSSGGVASWSNYVPKVNDQPYFKPEYSAAKKVANRMGEVFFEDLSEGRLYHHFFSESASRDMSGLEVTLYKEYKTGRDTGSLFAYDPQRRFMPLLISLDKAPRFIKVYDVEDAEFRYHTPTGFSSWRRGKLTTSQINHDLFIQEILKPFPSYDTKDMHDLPGYLYIGDWSFNDLKNLNTILEYGSLALTFLGPMGMAIGGIGISIFSKTGMALDIIDGTVDGVNLFGRVKHGQNIIDKNQEYSIYGSIDGSPRLVLFPSLMQSRDAEQDIKDLLPITPGNSWTFTDKTQKATTKVLGTEKIKGKNLVVIYNALSGVKEYFGFSGRTFYQYGASHSEIGRFFFEPAIQIGDDSVRVGKKYQTSSKVIFEKQNFSGTVTETINWISRENVLLSNKTPYGDCFKERESFSLSMSLNGQTAKDQYTANHWFAKNLGKVKMEIQGSVIELDSTNINSRMQGFGLLKPIASWENQDMAFPNLSHKIVEACKRLM